MTGSNPALGNNVNNAKAVRPSEYSKESSISAIESFGVKLYAVLLALAIVVFFCFVMVFSTGLKSAEERGDFNELKDDSSVSSTDYDTDDYLY